MTDQTTNISDFSDIGVSFGEYLKQERIRQGLSVEVISNKTGIKFSNIISLEEGNRRELPADAFVRGFIRIYARVLNIDSQKTLDVYDKEWGFSNGMLGAEIFLGSNSMAEPASIFADKQILVYLLIVLLVASAFFSYNYFSPKQELFIQSEQSLRPLTSQNKTDTIPPPFHQTKESPQEKKITPPNQSDEKQVSTTSLKNFLPQNNSLYNTTTTISPFQIEQENIDPTNLYIPDEENLPDQEVVDKIITQNASLTLKPSITTQVSVSELVEYFQPKTGPAKIEEPLLQSRDNIKIMATYNSLDATFTEKSWLRITIDQNEPVEYTFQPNETYSWKSSGEIKIFLGNAGGVRLLLNGVPVKINKRSGQTLKMTLP